MTEEILIHLMLTAQRVNFSKTRTFVAHQFFLVVFGHFSYLNVVRFTHGFALFMGESTPHTDRRIGRNRYKTDFERFPVSRPEDVLTVFPEVIDSVHEGNIRQNPVTHHLFVFSRPGRRRKPRFAVQPPVFSEPNPFHLADQCIPIVVKEQRHVLLPFSDPNALRGVIQDFRVPPAVTGRFGRKREFDRVVGLLAFGRLARLYL